MAFKKSFNTTANSLKLKDKTTNGTLSEHLNRFEREKNGCESLLQQSTLVDRFFEDAEMNDLEMLTSFFHFLLQSMGNSRQNAAKLVLRLLGSDLLRFAYEYLRPSPSSDEVLLNKFVPILSQILQHLLELHPLCWEQLDKMGIFDRLETYAQKASNEDTQLKIAELMSRAEQLREDSARKMKKTKPKVETESERDDPPPDDFHELSIYPTLDEIFQQQMPYLRKNITTGQYTNGTHYLDIHFRLLREDFLHPLREAICQYMTDDNRDMSFRNANVRLYRNAMLTGSSCSHVGVLFSIIIDLKALPKSISWTNSRRLIYGNLLAATFDDFASSCFLLTVEDRSNIDKNGTIYVRYQKELSDYKLMKIPPGTTFTLLETTSYFEAYRPILQALQNIKDDKIPLEKYLLHCDKNVTLPDYFENKSDIDFKSILVKNPGRCGEYQGDLSNVKDLTTWPNAQQLGLDDSQYQALQLGLTKAVALIQGPPGCGKTFLGVRLAELFYHNRERIAGCKRPILMICYTNHALDQFLSSIIQKLSLQPGQIVRVGGRSTHSEIEPFLIQKLRQQRRDVRSKNQDLSKKYEILKIIKQQMNDCQKSYYDCSQQLLDTTQLLRVMDKCQFLSLIEPILSKLDIFLDHWNSDKGGTYCCNPNKSKKRDDSESESNDDDDDKDELLSFYEKNERMKNRIHCHKLNKLSNDDQNEINQLFVMWLDAKQFDIINQQTNKQNEDDDDDDDEFQEQRRKKKRKNKVKATTVLKEILNDPFLTTMSPDTNINEENAINLNEDEEEIRRLENTDNSYIPFTFSNQTNEKDKKPINTEQLKYMQRLLNDKTTLLSDNAAKNIQDLWSKSVDKVQRQALYRYWLSKYIHWLADEWFRLNEQYDENHQSMQELWLANDRLYMDDAFIIAMTTHCASRYQKVLKEIAPRICIVEEAAEVFESHIVTAIGEQIEHLILIGDHVQLRPSPNVYTLAKHFKLDVSLFERLIKNEMPSIQLCVQHRSIPIISNLTHHFYDIPILNHDSVLNRPAITGVSHPLYFIDHQNFEENVADGSSKRNPYESNYIIRLAEYLINQGYKKSDITILTTYMGQRQLIQKTLNQFSHLKGIQSTVVDNFQGEENQIILLSLVRSNADQRLGYIAVDNRICVALSRAQNGFYVIGNFHLLAEHNETWKIIVNKMKQLNLIGQGLPINCANHLDNQLICKHPNDFLKRPLGGCGLKCESRLSCGHQCPLTCHSTSHNILVCQKPCQKKYDDCDHECSKNCHSTTACLPCSTMITLKMPNCEHTCDIPCFMRKTNQLECAILIPYTCPSGHQVQLRCCDLRNRELQDRLCTHPCDFTLECGHTCKGTCTTCLQGRFHCPCKEQELVVYICGHTREQRCHELGPRCTLPFIKLCDHPDEPRVHDNQQQCVLYQCPRFCLNRCRHRRCTQRCKVECDCLPCTEKCTRHLKCEHYCNGICGEPCIACMSCREKDLPTNIRHLIAGRNIRYATFVQLECGHLFETNALDKHVENLKKNNFLSNGFFTVDYPRCPTCQWSLVKCKRYSSLIKTIQNRIENISKVVSTLSGWNEDPRLTTEKFSFENVKLPESILAIVKRNAVNKRLEKLSELFVHVVKLFQNLSCQMDIERDKLFETIYEHIEKNDSLFFTRQQWSDLENEYNRLILVDRFRISKELLELDVNQSEIATLNDILFGPNQFTQLAWQLCNMLLNRDNSSDDTWKSILPDKTKWNDFEQDRLICDGKWILCSKGHLIWIETLNEQLVCPACQTDDHQPAQKPVFRGGYGRSRGVFSRR